MGIFVAIVLVIVLVHVGQSTSSLSQCSGVPTLPSSTHAKTNAKNKSCPHWTYDKYQNSTCICGSDIFNTVSCKDDKSPVLLTSCHCLSLSESNKTHGMVEGNCPYLCTNDIWTFIPVEVDFHGEGLCNRIIRQNRTGQLCGRCLEGYSPSAYSYSFMCVNCSSYEQNWIKYAAIAYVPVTLLFSIVLLFRLSALSAGLNANIFICQIMACPIAMSLLSIYMYYAKQNPIGGIDIEKIVRAISILYGVWNLDFFHLVFEPICLHPRMTTAQIISLDYGVALYPLLLILFTYLMVKFYDRIILVQYLCKPVLSILMYFNKDWTRSNFLIETFGTFFLLSYVKIINTSFALMMPVWVRNVTGHSVGVYLYYNGSMEYLGHEHVPYAVLAIFMFVTFNITPLFLFCLYPCRCFQSCLNCCRLNSQVLRTFMDAFQGCYKYRPVDCRCWAGFYLFMRIIVMLIFAFTQSAYFIVVTGLFMIIMASLSAIVRPYKQQMYNIAEVVLFLIAANISASLALVTLSTFDHRYLYFSVSVVALSFIVPPLYFIGYIFIRVFRKLARKLKECLRIRVGYLYKERTADVYNDESPLLNEEIHNNIIEQ